MPEWGYRVTICSLSSKDKFQIRNNVVIPIVFVDTNDKPVSSMCCVRISDSHQINGNIICNMRFISHGVSPEDTSSRFFMFNQGRIIGKGITNEFLERSYSN